MTRPLFQVEQVLALHQGRHTSAQISRSTGIPRSTIGEWISPAFRPRQRELRGCFRCTHNAVGSDYVYLLGLYLGDGCISCTRNEVWRLRIFQDARYVGLIAECRLAMSVISPTRVSLMNQMGCVEITSFWKHWTHVFPQHGPAAPSGFGASFWTAGSSRLSMTIHLISCAV